MTMEYPIGLSQDEIFFLEKHNVSPEKVFDAKNLSKQEYRCIMKQQGKIVAFHVTPCKKAGHQLRTRSGHCIMCDSTSLGFQKRNDFSGFVYFAYSSKSKLLKVGFSQYPSERIKSLNAQSYGNVKDWELKYLMISPMGNVLENQIQLKLTRFSTKELYPKTEHFTETKELFRCDINKAIEVLKDLDTPFINIPIKKP